MMYMRIVKALIVIILAMECIVGVETGKQVRGWQEKGQNKLGWVPKIMWTYWTQRIYDDDHIRKLFELNHKTQQKGWQLRHINNQNLHHWLSQIPDFGDKLDYPEFRNYKPHVRSNLIRLALIKHFGGVYFDFTTILTSSLDWILNIADQKLVSEKFGQSPDLFLLYSYHSERQTFFDTELNKNVLIYPSFQNFFIAGKKGSEFLQDWFDFYVEAKNISQKKYPLGQNTQDSWIVETAMKQNIKIGGFSGKYFEVAICGQIVLQRKQRKFDEVWEAQQRLSPRKLAVRHYKIWSMETNKVAYQIQNLVTFGFLQFIFVLMQSDKDYIHDHGVQGKHFIKLFNQNTIELNKFFLSDISAAQIPCPQNYYILENSLGYQYLLKDYPVRFYTNVLVNVSYNRYCLTFQEMKLLKQPEKIAIADINNINEPHNQIRVGAEYKKFTQSVQLMGMHASTELAQISQEIFELHNSNGNNLKSKQFIQQAVTVNQLGYEKIETLVGRLSELPKKECEQMEKFMATYLDTIKKGKLKASIFYFVLLGAAVVYTVFGIMQIARKIRNLRGSPCERAQLSLL